MPKAQDQRLVGAALPPATQVAAWERLHPGAAAVILTEFQRDRQHSRAMEWARLALHGLSIVCGLGAVALLALLGLPVVGPDGAQQAAGVLVAAGSGIGILVGRVSSRRPSLGAGCRLGNGLDPGEAIAASGHRTTLSSN